MLPADDHSPWRARELVTSALAEGNCSGETVDVARLLVSELLTNAVVHATTDMTVEIVLTECHLRVSVHDGTGLAVMPRPASSERTSGRGLLLVNALADAWGCEVSDKPDKAKVVWFVMSCDQATAGATVHIDGPTRPRVHLRRRRRTCWQRRSGR